MKKILSLFQIKDLLVSNKTRLKQENENGNNVISNNEIAETINKNTNITINGGNKRQFEELYESVINPNSSIQLREAILPIEALISQGKFSLAIQKYKALIGAEFFSKNEMFLIYIGILNCYINLDSSDETVEYWSNKILALGKDVDEIHRYYFLMGIREYGRQNYDSALVYLRQSSNSKPEYMNAITSEMLVNVIKGDMTYEDAIARLNELLKIKALSIKDYATIHESYGDIAFNLKDYKTAKEQYHKSNTYLKSLSKTIGLAICQYFISFKEIPEDGKIELEKIDFASIDQAEFMFSEIYRARSVDTIETIVKFSFFFYFNILALKSNYKKILELYNDIKQYSKVLTDDSINFVVEAQIFNGTLDEELLIKLDEYNQIKYEAFYYEKNGEYDKVVELLTPIFESQYRNDKVLKLFFLGALKELKRFDKYMQYYQRFSAHKDEVMRMNYLQLLLQKGEVDNAIKEAKELSKFVKNGFVLVDLMYFYINNNLRSELTEFFASVQSRRYRIIGIHRSTVFFQMMLHLLEIKNYEEYFSQYENTDKSFFEEEQRLILKINYYVLKNDYDELATAYYEHFKLSQNHNDLMKAVQAKLQMNQYHEADFYLSLVDPMSLEKPENYYMFHAIILKENNQLNIAFDELKFVLENLVLDLESPFHQFYTAFNLNNNRTDVAFSYMGEYYAKNPNPKWFKVIQHSENDTGEEILAKLEQAIGGKRDLSLLERYFSEGLIGISIYNKMSGTRIEDILFMQHYPFTTKHISRGNIYETKSKIDLIDNKIICDSTTLIILSSIDALGILDIFDELIIPFSTIINLNEKRSGVFSAHSNRALEYLSNSPKVKKFPVDEVMRGKNRRDEVIIDDIYDCIILSSTLMTPFLNTEVLIGHEFKQNEIIDINTLFLFIKENYPEQRECIAILIAKMRGMGYAFLSFDAEDIYEVYKAKGIEGITPFLKMGQNADYKTFAFVYTSFLKLVYDSSPKNDFETCSIKIIQFMDRYIGKTRYYASSIIRIYPRLHNIMLELVSKPSTKEIMIKKALLETLPIDNVSVDVTKTYEFNKLVSIASAFMVFVLHYVSLFNNSQNDENRCIELLKQNVVFNNENDINYILHYLNLVNKDDKRQP